MAEWGQTPSCGYTITLGLINSPKLLSRGSDLRHIREDLVTPHLSPNSYSQWLLGGGAVIFFSGVTTGKAPVYYSIPSTWKEGLKQWVISRSIKQNSMKTGGRGEEKEGLWWVQEQDKRR